MKVLGIDPGTAACGYGIVQENGNRLRALDFGWWKTPASARPELRLKTIYEGVVALIEREAPDAVALEESFVGADARTALSVGQARGAVLVAAALAGVECAGIPFAREADRLRLRPRREGAGQKMVQAILRLDAPPTPDHAADALAVAICHAMAPPLLKVASA